MSMFFKHGTLTLGFHGEMVGGMYFPTVYILTKDFR